MGRLLEGTNMTAIESRLFPNMCCVFTSLHYLITFITSSDMHIYALCDIAHPLLHIHSLVSYLTSCRSVVCSETNCFCFNVNKNPTDATVCRYLFTTKLFRVLQHPSSGVSKTVPAASGTGHTTCTATPLLRGLIWTGLPTSDHVGGEYRYK